MEEKNKVGKGRECQEAWWEMMPNREQVTRYSRCLQNGLMPNPCEDLEFFGGSEMGSHCAFEQKSDTT